jgi:predicted kinase
MTACTAPDRPAPVRRVEVPRSRPVADTGHAQRLVVPRRSLVVLAGLPGAGKTTLLRRLRADRVPGVRALDAEDVAQHLRAHARRVPYRSLRPAVHGLHLLRVLRHVRGPAACVLTTDPMTSAVRRLLLGTAARCSGRSLSVVLLEVTEEQALLGQRTRGRALGPRRMARHVARSARLRAALARTGGMSFVDEVLVLPRVAADRLTALTTAGGAGRPASGRCLA